MISRRFEQARGAAFGRREDAKSSERPYEFLRARICTDSRGRCGDDRSSFLRQKRPYTRATDPKCTKTNAAKPAKKAFVDSQTLQKGVVFTKNDEILPNVAFFEVLERNARVLTRFFAQFCARRTRLARAKHVNASFQPDEWRSRKPKAANQKTENRDSDPNTTPRSAGVRRSHSKTAPRSCRVSYETGQTHDSAPPA